MKLDVEFIEHSRKPESDIITWAIIIAVCAFLIFIVMNVLVCRAYAEAEIPPDNLWKGLIGEAVGEGYDGMYAVCWVYRNRLEKGMSLGCVALKRKDLDKFIKKQGVYYEYLAKDIVERVFYSYAEDPTFGSTHYESVLYPKPKWAYAMQIRVTIGKHIFYKERIK